MSIDSVSIEEKEIIIKITKNSLSAIYDGNFVYKVVDYNNNDFSKYIGELNNIIDNLGFKPSIKLLIKSNSFLVINTNASVEKLYESISNITCIELDELLINKIKNNSYLVCNDTFIVKYINLLKDYKINAVYDSTLINSLYLLPSNNFLYVDISYDNFDIVNVGDSIQKRGIKSELDNLLFSIKKELHLDYENTIEYLNTTFATIDTYEKLIDTDFLGKDEILSFVNIVTQNIQESTELFCINENIDNIISIYLGGDILHFDFLVKILQTQLNINPINIHLKTNNIQRIDLDLLLSSTQENLKNLQLSLQGLEIKDNKDEYIFVDNVCVKKKKLSKEQKERLKIEAKIKINSKKTKKINLTNAKKSILKMEMNEIVQLLKDKFNNMQNKEEELFIDENAKEKRNITILVGLSIFFVLYLVVYLFQSTQETLTKSTNMYVANMDNYTKELDKTTIKLYANRGIDKIFWTKKLLTLSKNMPNAIWLSSLSLNETTKMVNNKKVVAKTMVLEARAMPSSIGHISNIALYMTNLLQADPDFRKDFEDIRFDGAKIVSEYGYEVVDFKLICYFRKDIKQKEIEQEEKMKNKIQAKKGE